jgi:hypothetical protein
MAAGFMAGFGSTMSKLIEDDREYYRELATKKRDYLQTYGTKAVLERDEKANGAVSLFNTLVTAGIPQDDLRYVLDTTGVSGLAELKTTLSTRKDLTPVQIKGLVEKSKDYVAENPNEDITEVMRRAYGLYKSTDNPVEQETNMFAAVLGLDARMMERNVINDVYLDGFKGYELEAIMARGGPKPGESLRLNLPTKPASERSQAAAGQTMLNAFDRSIDAKIAAQRRLLPNPATSTGAQKEIDRLELIKGQGTSGLYDYAIKDDPALLETARILEIDTPGIITRNSLSLPGFSTQFTSWYGDLQDDATLDGPNTGPTGPEINNPPGTNDTPGTYTPTELRAALAKGELAVGTKVTVNGNEVEITQAQIDKAAEVKGPGMTKGDGLTLEKDGGSLLPPVEEETSATQLPDRSAMEAKLQEWMSYLTTPSDEQGVDDDLALQRREEALNDLDEGKFTKSSDAIDDKLAMQKRETALNDFDLPVPPRDLPPIDTPSVNTEADLKAAIAKRIGNMPPDYKVQVANTVSSLNEVLEAFEASTKDFETSVNVGIEKAIDTVSVDNLAEAISNMSVRMFDTVVGDETLEERIMQNEGQRNRAAAFAKLQQQFSELTLFPKGTPGEIDLGPNMGEVTHDWLHSTQDSINTAIASAAKSFLSKIGIGKPSTEAAFIEAIKAKEAAEARVEPLVARPEKTKEMTSSDKARLQRAMKIRDTGLIANLYKKYGMTLVQKEMGL